MAPTVHSLPPPPGSDIDFGAIVENIDLENLTGKDESIAMPLGAAADTC